MMVNGKISFWMPYDYSVCFLFVLKPQYIALIDFSAVSIH